MKSTNEYKESGLDGLVKYQAYGIICAYASYVSLEMAILHPKQILNFGKMALFLGTEWKI